MSSAGTIIFLNGTSSAGKSSIRRALPALLEDHTEIVDIDQVALEMLQTIIKERHYMPDKNLDIFSLVASVPESILSKQDVIDLYPAAQKKAYELIRKFFLEGKNVITETVVFGYYDTRQCLDALHDLPVMFAFVYCSPKILLKHVLERNQLDDKGEHRDILIPFTHFLDVCKKQEEGDYRIDTMTREGINALFDSISLNMNCDCQNEELSGAIHSLHARFISTFKLHEKSEVGISPILNYDCIINTEAMSSQECAEQILRDAHFSKKNALERNYNIMKDIPVSGDERSSLEYSGYTIWQKAKTYSKTNHDILHSNYIKNF